MSKNILILTAVISLAGCQSILKDAIGVAATPDELSAMSSIDVCKHLGYSQWRNQPQAYLDAKVESEKRILAKSVKTEDCDVFAEMAIRRKRNAAENAMRRKSSARAKSVSQIDTKGCYWVCNNGKWMAVKNGVCIMPLEPVKLCM